MIFDSKAGRFGHETLHPRDGNRRAYRTVPVFIVSIATTSLILACILLIFQWPGALLPIWRSLWGKADNRWIWGWNSHDPNFEGDVYNLGVGKADITGPVVEINLMGYADPNQVGTGLRQRLYSRAFIIGDAQKVEDRFIYLVLDTQSGDTAIRYGILDGLAELGPDFEMYGSHNLAVTGTHSHSGPGAWLNYLLPQITSRGFDKQSYQAIVDGAIISVKEAHANLQPGRLKVSSTKVKEANINRSLFAYLANPEEERSRYNTSAEDDGSVDKDLTLLKFQRLSDGKNIGVLTWFATHGTSMLGNNTLISGDNKGVAAILFEDAMQQDDSAADNFVAGFSQSSVGDTSPNVLGAWCEDGTGTMCSFENSTCADGQSQSCHARGPFFQVKDNGASSCFEIGRRQYVAAKKIFDSMMDNAGNAVAGSTVKSFHLFHNMSDYSFKLANGTTAKTCPAALGYSFAAGTSDGPGAFDFTQNDPNEPSASPVWSVVSGFLKEPSESQKRCHYPKPILLDVGEMTQPYQWTPNVVDMQVLKVGQLIIIVSPGETTTMAGRRWKNAIYDSARSLSLTGSKHREPLVVLGGPANSYTHYISTPEEYSIQRYEGASTLYGPYTLNAYIDVTLANLHHLHPKSITRPTPGPQPPNNVNKSLSFTPSIVFDAHPPFSSFGAIVTNVLPAYSLDSNPRVSVTFVAANPRNDLRLGLTYSKLERLDEETSTWMPERDDNDWDLIFEWRKISDIAGWSEAKITWEADQRCRIGSYRILYHGDWRSITGKNTPFTGQSSEFVLY